MAESRSPTSGWPPRHRPKGPPNRLGPPVPRRAPRDATPEPPLHGARAVGGTPSLAGQRPVRPVCGPGRGADRLAGTIARRAGPRIASAPRANDDRPRPRPRPRGPLRRRRRPRTRVLGPGGGFRAIEARIATWSSWGRPWLA
jgi:hypothetical protein